MKLIQGIALAILLTMGLPASAKTVNPADLVIDGGYTLNQGVSQTTQLFLDIGDKGGRVFWVKVIVDPGIYYPPGETEPSPEQEPITAYIKYFPISRYLEVHKQLHRIRTFGVVNPYLDGVVECDGDNSTIRVKNRTVIMAYNCGTNGPDADAATFKSEALMKALASETLQEPDSQAEVPRQP